MFFAYKMELLITSLKHHGFTGCKNDVGVFANFAG